MRSGVAFLDWIEINVERAGGERGLALPQSDESFDLAGAGRDGLGGQREAVQSRAGASSLGDKPSGDLIGATKLNQGQFPLGPGPRESDALSDFPLRRHQLVGMRNRFNEAGQS